jgi:hypothetical protein
MVGLVDDDEVRTAFSTTGIDLVVAYHGHSTGSEAGHLELVFEFLGPLIDEERRDDDDRCASPVVEQVLAEDHAGFHRLPEADLVGKQIPLNGVFEHPPDDFHLVREQVDAGRK